MRPKVLFRLATLAIAGMILAAAPVASANDTVCAGVITGVHDNVVVPPGGACVINGALVLGNVKALEASRLVITNSNVRGNVDGDKADLVQVNSSRVRQNVTIKEGGPAAALPPGPGGFTCTVNFIVFTPCEALVFDSTVEEGNVLIEKVTGDVLVRSTRVLKGNVKLEQNVVPAVSFLSVDFSTVAQNIQVFKNSGPGPKFTVFNTAGESIQCFENTPPFTGAPNTAPQAQGQCGATPPAAAAALSATPIELPAIVEG